MSTGLQSRGSSANANISPEVGIIPRLYPTINPKDEHVIAAAIDSRADFIITLDKPLESEIIGAALGLFACSPSTFITTHLPTHPSFR